MADDWNAFPEVPQAKQDDFSAFPEVKGTRAVREATTSGQEQALKDRQTIGSMEPDALEAVKSAAWEAGDMALMNAPSFVTAVYQAQKNNTTWKEELAKQKEYKEALARQHPIASKIGTGVGFVGGLAVPLGPLAKVGTAAERLVAPVIGETAAKAIGTGAISGTASGISSGLETLDPAAVARDTLVGGVAGAALQPVLGRLANRFIKEPGMIDSTGNITERGMQEIKATSGLADEDVLALKDKLVPIIQEKGFSPASVKEAQLSEFGVEAPKSVVTGVKPVAEAAESAGERLAAGKETLGRKAEELIGAPLEDRLDPVKALRSAAEERIDTARGKYKGLFEGDGEIVPKKIYREVSEDGVPTWVEGEQTFQTLIQDALTKNLTEKNIPPNLKATKGYDYTQEAQKYLSDVLLGAEGVKAPFGKDLNLKNLESIRQSLSSLSFQAKEAQDRRGVGAYIKSFDDALQLALQKKMYSGADSAELLAKLKDARGYWGQMREDFFKPKGAAAQSFTDVMSNMIDKKAGKLLDDFSMGAMGAAQQTFNQNIMKPGKGLAFYEKVVKALGKDNPAIDAVRSNIRTVALDTGGDLKSLPRKIDNFLSPQNIELAKIAFNADRDAAGAAQRMAELRRLSKAIDIINKKPTDPAQKQSQIIDAVKRIIPTAVGVVLGYPHGLVGQVAGAAAAEGVASKLRGVGASRAISEELAGAPKANRPPAEEIPMGPFTGRAPFVRNVTGLYPDVEKDPNYEVPPLTIRPGRASGGRIAHPESIANSLVSMADKAKKTINNDTEVLLKTPDTHVAQALEIANRQIEG
jgi:hypothetical protein